MTASARPDLPPLATATPPEHGSSCEGYIARRLECMIDDRRYTRPSREFAIEAVIETLDDDPEAQEFLNCQNTHALDEQELRVARRILTRLHARRTS